MTANALRTCRTARRWALALSAGGLVALAGCRSDKEPTGGGGTSGVRKNDPLVSGPKLIPRQDLPVPERGVGTRGKADPLTSPTGRGDRGAGYTDDPERFKGTVLPGEGSTPASLAGRMRDGDELKIADRGVTLELAGGLVPPESAESVSRLYDRLEKLGVKREDRTLEREDGKYVFHASVLINPAGAGARRQYEGRADSAYEAVKQVVDQLAER